MTKKFIYHTSPEEIEKIDSGILRKFGSKLFFSDEPYYMTQAENPSLYRMPVDEDQILDVKDIPYLNEEQMNIIKPVIEDVKLITGSDDELAIDFLSENENIYDHLEGLEIDNDQVADISWEIQNLIGEAARYLGFKGAEIEDEQGSAYIFDMSGNEYMLEKRNIDTHDETEYDDEPKDIYKKLTENRIFEQGLTKENKKQMLNEMIQSAKKS